MNTYSKDGSCISRAPAFTAAREEARGISSLLMKAAAGAAVATGIAISQGTGIALASTHQVTLQYSCTFPVIGAGLFTGVVSWDFPDTVPIGKPTPPVPFTVTVQVPAAYAEAAHRFLGIASASGSGVGHAMVTAPQGKIPVQVSASVPSTNVPASGPITLVITSTFPSLTPTRPGIAKVTIGTITIDLTPRNAQGNITFLGTVTATCTPAPGQNNLVGSVLIKPTPQTAEPTTHPTAGPVRTRYQPKPPSPSPSPTHSTHPTTMPTPTTTMPTPTTAPRPPDHQPSWENAAIIGGLALAAAGAAAALRWLVTRHRL